MGFLVSFWRDAQAWDRSVKIGVGMALGLLVVLLALTLNIPSEARTLPTIGLICLVLVTQGLILWGNRHLVTGYAQAQQQFLAEDYVAARATLLSVLAEAEQKGKRPSVETLTLLGNTYRNLGLLGESEDILTTALQRQPQNSFPLYGFGRTLLAAGRFAEAEVYFQRALDAGGPAGMAFEMALAQVGQGQPDRAESVLRSAMDDPSQDEARRWMARQLLPEFAPRVALSQDDIRTARQFWQKEADRFAETPYGQMIHQLLDTKSLGR